MIGKKWHPCWDLNPEHQSRSLMCYPITPQGQVHFKMSCINNNGFESVKGCGCD